MTTADAGLWLNDGARLNFGPDTNFMTTVPNIFPGMPCTVCPVEPRGMSWPESALGIGIAVCFAYAVREFMRAISQ